MQNLYCRQVFPQKQNQNHCLLCIYSIWVQWLSLHHQADFHICIYPYCLPRGTFLQQFCRRYLERKNNFWYMAQNYLVSVCTLKLWTPLTWATGSGRGIATRSCQLCQLYSVFCCRLTCEPYILIRYFYFAMISPDWKSEGLLQTLLWLAIH